MSLINTNNGTNPTFFNDFFNDQYWNHFDRLVTKNNIPATNIEQLDDHFLVSVVSPGMKKEDFSISVNSNVLHVQAKTSSENNQKDDEGDFIRREYNYNAFKRSFRLPEDIDDEHIKVSYKDGILSINIPTKQKETKETSKFIKIH